ncbi:hypothetical protein NBRC110019_09750 [Neptunitalea chrysea]|uniref:Lipoprotein n=1 Tax=Neptunitalea chrysea TaxID=1647581 RepID=A0A9W6EUN1_9FLAO|nr:hypothetical protein [Neptunitalea chrysea]GLB51936.1 hypothetical protein NBRC110019_09750 [Neptunitalea chrysea]
MKKIIMALSISSFLFTGCNFMNHDTKEKINTGGKNVGKTATEFFEGVSKGVEETLECELVLSDELQSNGIETGAFKITTDSTKTSKNILTTYLIFNKNFDANISAKAFDKKGKEIGRAITTVKGTKGQAEYFDFKFNDRTDIGTRSKIYLE